MATRDRSSAGGAQGRILVVDDDEDSRRLLRHLLERAGYTVTLADGGEAALECLRADAGVDVLLLDVMMPNMDGFAVCKELKKSPATASLPVILLTARDDIDTRAKGMNLGVSEFLTKPVNKEELYLRLRTQIEARSREKALEEVQRRAEAMSG